MFICGLLRICVLSLLLRPIGLYCVCARARLSVCLSTRIFSSPFGKGFVLFLSSLKHALDFYWVSTATGWRQSKEETVWSAKWSPTGYIISYHICIGYIFNVQRAFVPYFCLFRARTISVCVALFHYLDFFCRVTDYWCGFVVVAVFFSRLFPSIDCDRWILLLWLPFISFMFTDSLLFGLYSNIYLLYARPYCKQHVKQTTVAHRRSMPNRASSLRRILLLLLLYVYSPYLSPSLCL